MRLNDVAAGFITGKRETRFDLENATSYRIGSFRNIGTVGGQRLIVSGRSSLIPFLSGPTKKRLLIEDFESCGSRFDRAKKSQWTPALRAGTLCHNECCATKNENGDPSANHRKHIVNL